MSRFLLLPETSYLDRAPDLLRDLIRFGHVERSLRQQLTDDALAAVDAFLAAVRELDDPDLTRGRPDPMPSARSSGIVHPCEPPDHPCGRARGAAGPDGRPAGGELAAAPKVIRGGSTPAGSKTPCRHAAVPAPCRP